MGQIDLVNWSSCRCRNRFDSATLTSRPLRDPYMPLTCGSSAPGQMEPKYGPNVTMWGQIVLLDKFQLTWPKVDRKVIRLCPNLATLGQIW